MKWVLVQSFASEMDANIAKSTLEASGLKCHTQLNCMGDTLLGAFGMRTGPTDLLVKKQDFEEAQKRLNHSV